VLERLILIQQSALNLRPLPTRSELTQQLSGILAPLLPSIPLGGDGVRSVGGLSQVMVGESRYVAVLFKVYYPTFSFVPCVTELLEWFVADQAVVMHMHNLLLLRY
jgi:hypothetical protein